MSRDDIIRMAREAQGADPSLYAPDDDVILMNTDDVFRFAELVVASELATLRAQLTEERAVHERTSNNLTHYMEEEEALRAQLTASEASRKELRGLSQRVHQADALSHNCPLWKDIDAALANDAEQKGGTVCTCNTGPHLAYCDMFVADQPNGAERKGDQQSIQAAKLHCPICKQPQFNSPSGMTCRNGHGGEIGIAADQPKDVEARG